MLRLRFADYTRATRSHSLPWPSDHTRTILDTVRHLLLGTRPLIETRGITLVGISVANLAEAGTVQPMLPFAPGDAGDLDAALDVVRERFGSAAITRAILIGRDHTPTVPLLPD
jgi:DNA polymerase-4